jgi:hypothetical protein
MRSITFIAAVLLLASVLTLGACGRSVTSRYKLTLSVDTPEGVKTAFSVVESYAPESGPSSQHGQAVYLDLGSGRRPLIALLTAYNTNKEKRAQNQRITWSRDNGPMTDFVLRLYGDPGSSSNVSLDKFIEDEQRLSRHRGPKPISPDDLPDLVTFSDVKDPKSVMLVDPNDLATTLGPGVTWKSITLEVTDELLTTGIEKNLPWLDAYFDKLLDGHRPGQQGDGSIASIMNTGSFWMRKN